jgi:hypothetical protein
VSTRDDNLDDEGWEVRETFAYFGRAYMASVLEVGLESHCKNGSAS